MDSSMHSANICVITHFQDRINIELMKNIIYNLHYSIKNNGTRNSE